MGNELKDIAGNLDGDSLHFVFSDVAQDVKTLYLDITDIDAVRRTVADGRINVIINCAAYTDVEKAEEDVEAADRINHRAVANLAKAAAENNALLIHISTDYVFDGKGCVPYKEGDATLPLGVYGATKRAGEEAVIASGCRYMIFRTAWLYSAYGNNFVKTMQRLTSEKESIQVVADQVGTPTYAADLAAAVMQVFLTDKTDRTGIYHFTDEGVCSWYDLACAVNELCGHHCKVRPCRSDEYPSKVERPHYSVLDKSKFKETFGMEIPHWREALKEALMRLGTISRQL